MVRRLWDSWEDDAEIRDVATGRFIDRDKLHYIDFAGRYFRVKGPSITPAPAAGPAGGRRAGPRRRCRTGSPPGSADVVLRHPAPTPHAAAAIVAEVRREQTVGRPGRRPLHIFADLVVFLDDRPRTAARAQGPAGRARRRRAPLSDAAIFTGTPGELADLLAGLAASRADGFRLRPAVLPARPDRDHPGAGARAAATRGLFRTGYEAGTLRGLLGLPRPANRYAAD